jgi:hypothetical protein
MAASPLDLRRMPQHGRATAPARGQRNHIIGVTIGFTGPLWAERHPRRAMWTRPEPKSESTADSVG